MNEELQNLNMQIRLSERIDILMKQSLKLMDIVNDNQKEVNDLKDQLKLTNDLLIKANGYIEVAKAKLEVSQQNRITL